MRRLEHLAACRKWRKEIADMSAQMGLGRKRSHWRSWAHHPFANTQYTLSGMIPHQPRWELNWATWGEINHEEWGEGCEGGYYFVSCALCGSHHSQSGEGE